MTTDTKVTRHLGTLGEFIEFLAERKSYWLAPVLFVLLALGTLGVFLEGSVLAPAIYSIF
jgi:hypothetical protein